MQFICADCYEETEWSEEKLDHLYLLRRDPVCLECGGEHIWPASESRRKQLRLKQSLEELGDTILDALEPMARFGNRAMRKWRGFWR